MGGREDGKEEVWKARKARVRRRERRMGEEKEMPVRAEG